MSFLRPILRVRDEAEVYTAFSALYDIGFRRDCVDQDRLSNYQRIPVDRRGGDNGGVYAYIGPSSLADISFHKEQYFKNGYIVTNSLYHLVLYTKKYKHLIIRG